MSDTATQKRSGNMAFRIVAILIVVGLGALILSKQKQARDAEAVVSMEFAPKPDQLAKPDVTGVTPEAPPEFDVVVNLVRSGDQHKLEFTVTERHGWYGDHIYVEFWHVEQDEEGEWQQVGDSVQWLCRKYLDFNDTLVDSTVLSSVEWPQLEDYGSSEHWQARVARWGKVLAKQ